MRRTHRWCSTEDDEQTLVKIGLSTALLFAKASSPEEDERPRLG